MRNKRLGRFLVQFVRRVSLPFPFAILLSILLLKAADRILRPERSNISSGDPGEYMGGILLAVLVVILQALIGLPSLILLDRCQRRLGAFLAIASIMSFLLSAMLASVLQAPQFGESFGWMFSRVLAFVTPPLLLSFLLAYILRPLTNQDADKP